MRSPIEVHRAKLRSIRYNRAYSLAYFRAKRRGEPIEWCRRFGRIAARYALEGCKPVRRYGRIGS